MSAAFLPEFTSDRSRCAKCKCDAEINDLTNLGHLDLCAKCYREAIADMPWQQEKQENSGAREE